MNKKQYILIKFNFKGFHKKLFYKILKKINQKAKILNINVTGIINLPIKTHRFTVLRGPHINKTAREQFELKIHHKVLCTLFDFNNNNYKKKAKIFVNFIKNSCTGLQLKVTYKIIYLNK